MPVSEERHPIAQVTRSSRDGWRAFAKRNSTTTTALAEVLGQYLGDVTDLDAVVPLRRLVEEAAELADRRLRRGD